MRERQDPARNITATSRPALDSPRRSALVRSAMFFAFWLILMQSLKAADLAFGGCAAVAATWVSLRLLPPDAGCLRFGTLLAQLPHFLWQSLRAGVDIAQRALSPRMPLHPGFVRYLPAMGPGLARNTFASITSLLPGSVACDEADGALVYHCLDTSQPVAAQLQAEERRLARALVAGNSHG